MTGPSKASLNYVFAGVYLREAEHDLVEAALRWAKPNAPLNTYEALRRAVSKVVRTRRNRRSAELKLAKSQKRKRT